MESLHRLRQLAAWYREFAERAGDPAIWEARLMTAKRLDQQADRLEAGSVSDPNGPAPSGIDGIEGTRRAGHEEVSADANLFPSSAPKHLGR